jgi:hypothetical protein
MTFEAVSTILQPVHTTVPAGRILDSPQWRAIVEAHEARVAPWIEPHLQRLSRGESHPVYDFLFSYYSFSPGQLRRWHPGLGITVTGPGCEEFLTRTGYEHNGPWVTAAVRSIKPSRLASFRWLLGMLEAAQSRPAWFGCHGLHEWAMVYRSEAVRHSKWPLRLPAARLAAFVESQSLCCTHYDAFRFFTPNARPLNRLQPERSTTTDLEQRGCLHANMDLYKWASKLVPFASSTLVADCFELAREIRESDMRASPYDFTALGFPPIPIEHPEGRAEYEALQRIFTHRADPLRARLISLLRELVHTL